MPHGFSGSVGASHASAQALDAIGYSPPSEAAPPPGRSPQGQICLDTRRIIIQQKIADEFLAKFAARTKTLPSGDPQDPRTIIGPLITPAAVKLVDDRVNEAITKTRVKCRSPLMSIMTSFQISSGMRPTMVLTPREVLPHPRGTRPAR
jgi:hypothetical protein